MSNSAANSCALCSSRLAMASTFALLVLGTAGAKRRFAMLAVPRMPQVTCGSSTPCSPPKGGRKALVQHSVHSLCITCEGNCRSAGPSLQGKVVQNEPVVRQLKEWRCAGENRKDVSSHARLAARMSSRAGDGKPPHSTGSTQAASNGLVLKPHSLAVPAQPVLFAGLGCNGILLAR